MLLVIIHKKMADEASLRFEVGSPIPYTVANATAITKGAVLALTDPMTAAAVVADNDVVAGIAAADKIASDGVTKLSVYRSGYFVMTGSGNITAGDPVRLIGGSNRVLTAVATITLSGSRILGTAMETATNGETLVVEVRPTHAFVTGT